jgi:serine/threonine protein kinase
MEGAVVTYSINASKLKQIYGHSLRARARDGSETIIRIPSAQPAGWPRGGAEAFGLKVEFDVKRTNGDQTIPAFLKLFKTEVPEREHRTRLLIETELAKKSHFFFGLPFGWLGRVNINGVDVIAHFTRMIPGPYDGKPEDFGRLRSTGRWTRFDNETRQTFAGELAVTVAALERAGIIHGDISPGNVLIGYSPTGKEICILCDYDGYHHDQVRPLPRKDGKVPCRPLGNPGYQYPALISALEADQNGDDDKIRVETDRFALAVAICEMMIWSDKIEKLLEREGRGELLARDVVMSKDLMLLSKSAKHAYRIIDSFPKGFKLLSNALHAGGPKSMPSPEDWIQALGFNDDQAEFQGRPVITIFRVSGTFRAKEGTVRLANKKGDFGKVVPQLVGINYRFIDRKLELIFGQHLSVKRRCNGRLRYITNESDSHAANPGDTYHVGEWEFQVADYPEVERSI